MTIVSKRELEILIYALTPTTGKVVALAHKSRTGEAMPKGTLYTIAQKLERAGLLTQWSPKGGDKRFRLMQISAAGRQALVTTRAHHAELAKLLSDVLGSPWRSGCPRGF